jgi:hypothetical protein
LTLVFPAFANSIEKKQPTVLPYSLAAMGCMILRECTEGVEQFTPESIFLSGKEFDTFREEIKSILAGLNKLNVPVYVGPTRYFTPRTVGLYKPEFNRFFVNEELLKDPREFLGTLPSRRMAHSSGLYGWWIKNIIYGTSSSRFRNTCLGNEDD